MNTTQRTLPGSIITFHGSITVKVHSNIAAVQSDQRPNEVFGWPLWYGADGRVLDSSPAWRMLKKVGDRYIVKG
jgi:hypothetical protein